MEISCCGHCTTTVQEEKQVEEEEVGKGRDSLQRKAFVLCEASVIIQLQQILQILQKQLWIQDSGIRKSLKLDKNHKGCYAKCTDRCHRCLSHKKTKKFKSRCCSFWRTDRESDNFLFEQRHQRKPRQLVWLTGILSPIKKPRNMYNMFSVHGEHCFCMTRAKRVQKWRSIERLYAPSIVCKYNANVM